MPEKPNTADPRRVVCQCRSRGCYKGFYINAHGHSQCGVGVLAATKEAHERSDLRSQIHSLSLFPLHDSPNSSGSPRIDIQNQLIGPLTNLGFDIPEERTPTRGAPRHTLTPVVLHSNDERYHPAHVAPDISATNTSKSHEDSNKLLNMIKKSTNTSTNADLGNQTQIFDPDVAAAASIARKNGFNEYHCGKFVSLLQMNVQATEFDSSS